MDPKNIKILPDNFKFDPKLISSVRPLMNLDLTTPVINQNAIDEKFRKDDETYENIKAIRAATESIDAKLDHVSNDIEYILHSIGANFQRLERLGREEKEALDSLILALQYKNADSKFKIKELLADKGADFIINLIFLLVQLKMTTP